MEGEDQPQVDNANIDADAPVVEAAAEENPAAQDDGAPADMEGEPDDMEGGDEDAPVIQGDGEQVAEEQEEHKVPSGSQLDYASDPRIQYMLKFLDDIMNYKAEEEATAPTNERLEQFYHFLERPDNTRFFVWVQFDNPELRFSFDRAPHFYESESKVKVEDYQIVYFLKRRPNERITAENIQDTLIGGMVDGDPLDQLLKTMNDACPKLLGENEWPDNVKKEFMSNLHNFMAHITEQFYVARGMQNLYIPNEDLNDMDTAVKDKDLIQRLESIVICWTRQIKELVTNQDSSQSGHDNSSPLDEIKHWTDRTNNLKGLTLRLTDAKLIKITQVLERHQSSYLQPFMELKQKIEFSFQEAESNLKFLKILEEPCRKIERAQPKEIPTLLPDVLNSVRVIWELSDYATPERMKSLLTKISNQINQRCRSKIKKEDMLGRDVEKCMRDLDESIECCEQWKEICVKMSKRIIARSSKTEPKWDDDEGIFAENEAFIQRCKDLKEICEGQLQFAQRGASCQMPVFGGTKGKEWKLSLEGLKGMFDKHLDAIRNLTYDILDVKITSWHDDYGQNFKDQVKNIEIIYQTIIQKTFGHVSTIEDAVEMLENFYQLAKRQNIITFVQTKAAELVYNLFIAEMKEVEDTFEASYKKRPVMPISHPHYGGMAIWIFSLIKRIDRAKKAIDGIYFVPDSPGTSFKEDAEIKYKKLKESLDSYIQSGLFRDWNAGFENEYVDYKDIENALKRHILLKTTSDHIAEQPAFIEKNVLFKNCAKENLLESNFDTKLRKVVIECNYWNKVAQHGLVNLNINLTKLHNRRESLRVLQENVMLIVRDYNHIMNLIDDKEKRLFQEHLELLNKEIKTGLQKHQWSNTPDQYVLACRGACREMLRKIKDFQSNQSQIRDEFEMLGSTILTNVQKQMYRLEEFNSNQNAALEKNKAMFKASFEKIRGLLIDTYQKLFLHHGPYVQKEWSSTMKELDKGLEKALRSSVKSTLLDFQHHIKGDQQEIVPIFSVETELDINQDEWKVCHSPNHAQLKRDIELLLANVTQATSVIPRIEGIFKKDRQAILDDYRNRIDEADRQGSQNSLPPAVQIIFNKVFGNNYANMTRDEQQAAWDKQFDHYKSISSSQEYYEKVKRDPNIEQIREHIKSVVDAIQQKMDEDCKMWQLSNEIRHLSSLRTVRGQNRYLKSAQGGGADDAVNKYKNGIESLKEIVDEVRHNRPSTRNEQFIVFQASNLKNELMEQGHTSIQQIFGNLINESKNELHAFLNELKETVDELTTTCVSQAQFKKNQDKWIEVNDRKGQLQGKIDPIKKKFEFIMDDNYSDIGAGTNELTEDDKALLLGIDKAWKEFTVGMQEAKTIIQKTQMDFKSGMEERMEEFKKEADQNLANFIDNAPNTLTAAFEADGNKKAFEVIRRFQQECMSLRQREQKMQFGLEIFQIEPGKYDQLAEVEKKNKSLEEIWTIKSKWDSEWNEWKQVNFYDMNIRQMEDKAMDIQYMVTSLPKEDKKIPVTEAVMQTLTDFLSTLPLLTQLRDESMRDRHWKELQAEVKEEFTHTDPEFTLDKLYAMKLLDHQDKIEEICSHARQQLKIEKSLDNIEELWDRSIQTNLEIDICHTKGSQETCYQIKQTDNIIALIEDHSGELAKHKASQFYKQFDDRIDYWENNIAKITETLEILMSVQEKWQYLESIFGGQQHIQKQLAQEFSIFKSVDKEFKSEMLRIYRVKNAYKSLVQDNPDFINQLNNLNKSLEAVQKKLNDWLAARRTLFPRFFFLSNEDLLEIIGQAKNPATINKHIKKIFEGINRIDVDHTQQAKNQKEYVITGVFAEDGERLPVQELSQSQPLELTNNVESWMKNLTEAAKISLMKEFYIYKQSVPASTTKAKMDKEKMTTNISNNIGQILLTYNQIEWTQNVKGAIKDMTVEIASSQSNPLKKVKQVYKNKMAVYTAVVEQRSDKLNDRNRKKVEAMIIMEQHNFEVVDKLFANKQINSTHFEWLSQLRYEMEPETGNEQLNIICEQLNFNREYGYEYQGNNGRLVVTSLTDKAYMTLTNALHMFKGGAPQGPAGTGKTETTKDLGKNLATFVVIQNCSEQMDHNSLGTNFCGLAMEGAWGCFDEFNRITLDVLSVITTMIKDILDFMRKGGGSGGVHIGDVGGFPASPNTGLFITMNPGYAGRTELPDNLASLFRPVAMMVPDFHAIAKNILMSKGFTQSDMLSKKICTVYDLMQRQLSRQDFYDFSTRAVKSCVLACGNIKRREPNQDEQKIVLKAIRDMNLPKLIFEDVALFDNLFMDLFPEIEEPEIDYDALQIAIEQSMIRKGLQVDESIVVKCMQLKECKDTRHGNMLIGQTMSGKTTCWELLVDALNYLHKEEKEEKGEGDNIKYEHLPVKYDCLNPKSISVDELYGAFDDQAPPQWQMGTLSSVLKTMVSLPQNVNRWMIIDGPVDTLWIESMNSVLDDSQRLTLVNCDVIQLTPNTRLLFEVDGLAVASPATVSRVGMVYLDIDELGWKPIVRSWLDTKKSKGQEFFDFLSETAFRYLDSVIQTKKINCKELVTSSDCACVRNMCKLFDSFEETYGPKEKEMQKDDYFTYMEKWFVFSLIWSVGATIDESSRRELDIVIRDIEPMFPTTNTVFDYHISDRKNDWEPWDVLIKPEQANIQQKKEFHEIYIQTVDWARNRLVAKTLIKKGSHVLFVGNSGVGKTVLIEKTLLAQLNQLELSFTINFSAGTSSKRTQEVIESNFDRRAKNKYKPKNSKVKAICFIDDLNMPKKDEYGSQPPLELLRQWFDTGFWYDRVKEDTPNVMCDLQFLAAMGKPGGGRAHISPRLTSKFHLINFTNPNERQMKKIYTSIFLYKFSVFGDDIKQLEEFLPAATINIFQQCISDFLPTPAKTHYIYNMRDISKVFQGLFLADRNYQETKEQIIKMWGHEVLRVFHDRLINSDDQKKFKDMLNSQLEQQFSMNYTEHCMTDEVRDAVYADFLTEDDELKIYEEVKDFNQLRDHLNQQLHEYNRQKKVQFMDIVLFTDVIIHVTRIYRILNMKRGHALLVGVGGSGRHSLTRLSAFISRMNVDQLEIKKDFTLKDFRYKLIELYEVAAFRGIRVSGRGQQFKTVFIFSDNDVVDETFLEDIQNMLNAGIVPNIYTQDELAQVREDCFSVYKNWCRDRGMQSPPEQAEIINEWFFDQVKDRMHLSICMSPIGERFRDYTRNFPALINNTTINWFMAWPEEALIEVAKKYIDRIEMEPEEEKYKSLLAQLCGYSFAQATMFADKMQKELRRIFYVTPTNFIELLKGYEKILKAKRHEIGTQATKLSNGLGALEDASTQVHEMTTASETTRADVQRQNQICQDMRLELAKQEKDANDKQKQIQVSSEQVEKESVKALALKKDAEADLAKAMPILEAAQDAVKMLNKKDIGEVKAYANPPKDIMNVMSAVMTVLNKPGSNWPDIKKTMTNQSFMDWIVNFDPETQVNETIMRKIEVYTKKDNFTPKILAQSSVVAGALCGWVKAVEDFYKALKIVKPKIAKKVAAENALKILQDKLKTMQDEYAELEAELQKLSAELKQTTDQMDELQANLSKLQAKIERGDKLVTGLADEKERWENTLLEYNEQIKNLIGDSALAAAFVSLCGPFPADYREALGKMWMKKVAELELPHDENYQFTKFLGNEAQIKDWQSKGLPIDQFSSENGVCITKGERWALNIDPQTQASSWIKQMHGKSLLLIDINDKHLHKKLAQAVVKGKSVLLQDVGEQLDPSLDNLLNKSFIKIGSDLQVKIGDHEAIYNKKFRLFITTRISNPHYTPEISTKVNVINFTIKEQGLEEQCLGIIVCQEQPQLEQTKSTVIEKIEKGNRELRDLEDDILSKLQETNKEEILDNVQLINKLQISKDTKENVTNLLQSSVMAMAKINETREQFRPCGRIASALFFVLLDLHKINPMYQFSLDWYRKLFEESIHNARSSSNQQNKMEQITKQHILNVYRQTCRSLFERHKILLAFQLAVKMKESSGEIDRDEYLFFLRGAIGIADKSQALPKPNADWIQESAWNHLIELDQILPAFANICQAIQLSTKEWKTWYSNKTQSPEEGQLPGEWETKCEDPLRKMIILRCFRPDRIIFSVRKYIESNLGKNEFVQSKATQIKDIYATSTPATPILIILSQGVDPTDVIEKYSEELGVEIDSISLGKGQSQKALKFLQKGAEDGKWCFLSNCHLSVGLLPELEAKLDEIIVGGQYKDSFRLIMSASPTESFPISLLQRSVKMTLEPPRGIKPNLLRLYRNIGPAFVQCDKEQAFRKSIFGLCWFHTLLLERKKFKSLGWNSNYPFNDSDWQVCADTLANYMGRYKDENTTIESYNKKAAIPWQAIQYLIATANYGGRVTDARDMRVIDVYANEIFNEELINPNEKWKPPSGKNGSLYQYPADEAPVKPTEQSMIFTPEHFLQEIASDKFPDTDAPEAYGQHTNAEINSQTVDSLELLEAILSLQPAVSAGGASAEEKSLQLIENLRQAIPQDLISMQNLKHKLQRDSDPINIVLVQEVSRYNHLIQVILKSLTQLELGIKGLDLISPELEKMMTSFGENKVPELWSQTYFSTKPLSNWKEDLSKRYNFFKDWVTQGQPYVFWLGAFTYPTGFTTSLLQRFSRKKDSPAIDRLEFDFKPVNQNVAEIMEHPKDGANITGLYLEGAKWDEENDCLCEPEVMELYVPMPVFHFKPIPKRIKPPQNTFECPCYYYPIRKGTVVRDSYMMKIDLKLVDSTPDHWIKRGTAILMSIGV